MEEYINPERIEQLIQKAKEKPLPEELEKFQEPIKDSRMRTAYFLLLFFAARIYMQSGENRDLLMERVFQLEKKLSPDPLDVDQMQALMTKCLTDADALRESGDILRNNGLAMQAAYHMYVIMPDKKESSVNQWEKLSKKDFFGIAQTIQDICKDGGADKVALLVQAVKNELEKYKDETYQKEKEKLERSLQDKPSQIQYLKRLNFYHTHGDRKNELDCLDHLIDLSLEQNQVDDAIDYLCKALKIENTPERRNRLHRLYAMQCPEGKDSIEYGFHCMINKGIEGVEEEYQLYKRKLQAEDEERIRQKALQQTQSSSSKRQQLSSSTRTKSDGDNQATGCGCLLLILVIAAVVGYMIFSSDTSNKENVQQEVVDVEKSSGEKDSTKLDEIAISTATQKTELSLGGLDIGIKQTKVQEILGKELSQEAKDGLDIFFYEHMKVYVRDGKVVGLISNNAKALTKRGIHQSSTLEEVKQAYGEDCRKSNYENLVLYEYTFKSMDNRDGILRFAIDLSNNSVDYISVRIPDETSKPKESKPAEQTAKQPAKQPEKPSTPPAQESAKLQYKSFTDNTFGFSFDYPATEPGWEQVTGDGKGAITYTLELSRGALLLIGNEFNVSTIQAEANRYEADAKISQRSDNTYDVEWWYGNQKRRRHVILAPYGNKMLRFYVELRQDHPLSSKEQEIVNHVMDSLREYEKISVNEFSSKT